MKNTKTSSIDRFEIIKKLVFVSALLISAASLAQETVMIPDLEGNKFKIQTLIDRGVLNESAQGVVQANPLDHLWFLGDIVRRGPHGSDLLEAALQLKEQSTYTVLIGGNHDFNSLAFLTIVPSLELGLIDEYNEWLGDSENNRHAQLVWWAGKFGLNDKFHNFWVEAVAEKLKVNPDSENFKESFYEEGKPNLDALKSEVSGELIAENFLEFAKPGGLNFRYLRQSNLVQVSDRNNVRYFALHSGQPSAGNLGVVPGVPYKYYEEYQGQDWLKKWEQDLNAWKDTQLDQITRLWNQWEQATDKTEKTELAHRLLENRLRIYGDAGWDPVTNQMEVDVNSVVYPEKFLQQYNSLPGIPEQKIVDLLAEAGVDIVVGGHVPVGDGTVNRQGYSFKHKKKILFSLFDTSYSPVEGQDFAVFTEDGGIRLDFKTRNGQEVVFEMPGPEVLKSWMISEDEDLKHKAEHMSKIGMIANGYIIVGFEPKKNVGGETVPDYDRFVLLKQDGYNFETKVVDQWGMGDVELEFPVSDLSKMFEEAYESKISMLEKYEKTHLNTQALSDLIQGAHVIISSGPADSSLSKVLDVDTGKPENVEKYLKDWESYLQSLDIAERYVFVGGGTTGLERLKNEIVHKINVERVAAGSTPFEMIGFITGVTNGTELDPLVENFHVSKAFYWDDYFPELLDLMKASKSYKSLAVEFAGGGGIVTQQILQAQEAKTSGLNMSIKLFEGISEKDSLSATDKIIESIRQREVNPQGLTVMSAKQGASSNSSQSCGDLMGGE